MPGESHPTMHVCIVVVAAALYALMSAMMKLASAEGDAAVALVARYLFACITLLPLYFVSGRSTLRTHHLRWHLLRGSLGFAMFLLYTLALERIPLPNVMVLNSSYLLFIPLLLFLFARRVILIATAVGLCLGVIGIAVVAGARPEGYRDWGTVLALCSGVASAGANVVVARLRRTDSAFTVVFYFFTTSLVLSILWAAITSGHKFHVGNWWLVIAVGALSAIYQQLLTFGFKHLGSELVSALMTGSLVFGFALDAVVFHQSPTYRSYLGTGFIVIAILTILHSERAGRDRRANQGTGAAARPDDERAPTAEVNCE
jgi:drug/metabolite transporter (DMT)-like permease